MTKANSKVFIGLNIFALGWMIFSWTTGNFLNQAVYNFKDAGAMAYLSIMCVILLAVSLIIAIKFWNQSNKLKVLFIVHIVVIALIVNHLRSGPLCYFKGCDLSVCNTLHLNADGSFGLRSWVYDTTYHTNGYYYLLGDTIHLSINKPAGHNCKNYRQKLYASKQNQIEVDGFEAWKVYGLWERKP